MYKPSQVHELAVLIVLIDGTKAGFERLAPYDLIGSHAIGTGFRLNNYLASNADLLAPAGEGFSAALATINEARTYVASMCCAMVEASLRRLSITRRREKWKTNN